MNAVTFKVVSGIVVGCMWVGMCIMFLPLMILSGINKLFNGSNGFS